MNIVEILGVQSRTRGDAIALIDPRQGAMTFAELEEASARAAGGFLRAGLRPGQTVLVLLPMSTDLYVTLLALLRVGLVAIFPDPSAGLEQLGRCCRVSPPDAMIAGAKGHLVRLLSPALRRIPVKLWRSANAEPAALAPCDPDTPALITFTSGSTAEPKCVQRTHGFLLAQHRALESTLRSEPGDVVMAGLPVFVLSHLAAGVTSVIPAADLRRPGAIDPAPVIRQMLRHRVRGIEASPALLEQLATYGRSLPDLRRIITGGAPVFPCLLDRLQQLAPSAEIVAVYGSTEAEPIAHVAHREIQLADRQATHDGAGLLAGTPVDPVNLRILPDRWGTPIGPYSDTEFAAASLPQNVAGEIVVQGEHVLASYLNGRGDELIKFRVGRNVWHRTGDAGYLDASGRLWLLGRCSARVDTLYPLAVEASVSDIPGVHRAAFFAHEGRRVLAIEPWPGSVVNEEEVRRRVAWAAISDVCLTGRIPVDRRHNAKIDYTALAAASGLRDFPLAAPR